MTGSAWEIGVHLDALACSATPLLLTAEMGDATELGAAFFACPSSTWFDIDIIIYERHYHVQKACTRPWLLDSTPEGDLQHTTKPYDDIKFSTGSATGLK